MKSFRDKIFKILLNHDTHDCGSECVDAILKLIDEEIIGEDEKRNPEYSIFNAFRRMEEDVREHINSEKRKQRKKLGI